MFFADRRVEQFVSSTECLPGGLRHDLKSLKRLKQAQRADTLLAFTREQRLQAVVVSPEPVMKPLPIKKRLTAEHIRSVSSHIDRGSACYDSTSYATLPCGGGNKEAASATGPVDGERVGGTSKWSRKRKADQVHSAELNCGLEAAVSDHLNVQEEYSGSLTGEVGLTATKTERIEDTVPTLTSVNQSYQFCNDLSVTAGVSIERSQEDEYMMSDVASAGGRAEDSSMPQYSTVSGPDGSDTQQDPSAAGYTGETEHTV